jgi:hypothetical protein
MLLSISISLPLQQVTNATRAAMPPTISLLNESHPNVLTCLTDRMEMVQQKDIPSAGA